MSSTRTISLLIALAFLPLVGFATAQTETPVTVEERCAEDNSEGSSVRVVGEEVVCTNAQDSGIEEDQTCESDGSTGNTVVTVSGEQVLCHEDSEALASLTVSFHAADADDSAGPGGSCEGADISHITATIPPGLGAEPPALTPDIANTRCVMVTANNDQTFAVALPSADGASLALQFYTGEFQALGEPSMDPLSNGQCAGGANGGIVLGGPNLIDALPPSPASQCVQATLTLASTVVLRIAIGIPAGIIPGVPCDPSSPTFQPEDCTAAVCAEVDDAVPVLCEGDLPVECDPQDPEFAPTDCAELPGLGGGVLGYHAEFTFFPDLAADQAPAFQFLNNQLLIKATLTDANGNPLAFAPPGSSTTRAQFVLSKFPPADGDDEDDLPDLVMTIPANSISGADQNVASLLLLREQLVTASADPGTVWTIRIESPNQPLLDAPDGDGLVSFPSAFSFYSAAAGAVFPDAPELADVLDSVPTPIRALPKPVATIVSNAAFTASEPASFGRFAVSLTPSQGGPTEVPFSIAETAAGSAKRGVDYYLRYADDSNPATPEAVILGNSLNVPGGTSVVAVDVVPIDDTILEYAQTVVMALSEGAQAAVGSAASATLSIADNEVPAVSVTSTDLEARESGASPEARVTFTRTSPPGPENAKIPELTVTFGRAVGSTTSANDFGALCANPVPDLPLDDLVPRDCFRSDAGQCPARLAGTCDTLIATLATGLGEDSPIACTGSGDAELCTVALPAGASETSLLFLPVDDRTYEGTEFLQVHAIDMDPYDLGTEAVQTIALVDNDIPSIGLSLNGQLTHEAGNPLRLTITRAPPPTDQLSDVEARARTSLPGPLAPVQLEKITVPLLVSGEGTLGSDFDVVKLPGSTTVIKPVGGGVGVDIPAGQTSVTVLVAGLQDREYEGLESGTLALPEDTFGPGSTAFPHLVGFYVVDDDVKPLVNIRAVDGDASEDGDRASLAIERFGDSSTDLVVSVVAGGTAALGGDYTLSATQVTIPAGLTTAVLTLTPSDDSSKESTEVARIFIVPDSAFLVGTPSFADVRILDDDQPAVHVTVPDFDLAESGATGAVVRVHRTAVDLEHALTVNYVVTGPAKSGVDFTSVGTSVTIPAGKSFADIAIAAIDDTVADANEFVTITLLDTSTYSLEAPASASVTIVDDDLPLTGDQDGDGLSNFEDPCPLIADPEPADLDQDGKGDACDDDQDNDGATDADELAAHTDPRDPDTDGDLVKDGKEAKDGTDALDPFSPDYRAKDVSARLEDDGMHVTWTAGDTRIDHFLVWRTSDPVLVTEVKATGAQYEVVDPAFPGGRHQYRIQAVLDGQATAGYDALSSGASAPVSAALCSAQPLDTDGDDLCDAREAELGTDPLVPDSDGDGLTDGAEDLGRYGAATDPLDADSDGDGIDDREDLGVDLESASVGSGKADLDATWVVLAIVLAGSVLVLSLVGVVRFMRRT
ncbi:MAG: hypothetical protein QOC71_2000 [Thermoplasmata archaeon]|nr:hypothetical protein [Thermoplasmata archaeon]